MDKQFTKISFSLDVAAQKVISEYILTNEQIVSEMEAGIKAAVQSIDIKKEFENAVQVQILKAIREASDWSRIKHEVEKQLSPLLNKVIEESIEKYISKQS